MKSFLKLILCGLVFVPIALAGASFNGIDKIGNFLVVHFSTGDVQIQLARGVTDGSAAPTGYVGEVVSATITADTNNSSNDAESDVTGGSITLTPGNYLLHWGANVSLASSGATDLRARVRVTDNANTYVAGTASMVRTLNIANGSIEYKYMSNVAPLRITTTTTYKLRFTCGFPSSTGGCVLRAADPGSFTGTDLESYFFATRIR